MNSFFEKLRNEILSSLAFIVISFVCYTSKITCVNKKKLETEKEKHGNVIFAFWHGRQFLLVFAHKFEKVTIMSSFSRDGELQASIMSKFGYEIIRGSSGKRGAVEGTLELMKRLEDGRDVAFAVDGPAGPGFQPKQGTLYLAQKTGKVIIPITSSSKKRKIFNNWDRYMLPFPFNKCFVVYGNPVVVRKEDDLNQKTEELKKELDRITEEADKIIKS